MLNLATTEGKILSGSLEYFTAARLLRESSMWANDARLIHRPTLHLLSHGIELLLKVPILKAGMPVEKVASEFGHDLTRLWLDGRNSQLKADLYRQAAFAWNEAATNGIWQEDDFSTDPIAVLDENIQTLSALHSRQTGFALRYLVPSGAVAPRPMFILDVFHPVAEQWVADSSILGQ